MCRPLRRRIDTVLFLIWLMISLWPNAPLQGADLGSADPRQVFKLVREKLALQRSAANQERLKIQAHIAKVESFRAGLSLPKDAAAHEKALQALDRDRQAIEKAEQRILLLEQAMQSKDILVPYRMQGPVHKKTAAGWEPMDATTPLLPGESIRTGAAGHVLLVLENGSEIELGPNSTFANCPQTNDNLPATIYELIMGDIRIKATHAPGAVRGEVRYRTPSAVAAVRGTEFRLSVDKHGLTHLVPMTGEVEMETLMGKIDRSKLDGWWARAASAAESKPIPHNKPMRVADCQGGVMVSPLDGQTRNAIIGQTLEVGDRLSTGTQGFAWLESVGGCTFAMASSSCFEIKSSTLNDGPVYYLEKGRLHIDGRMSGAKGDPPTSFNTSQAKITLYEAELEAYVTENGSTRIIPLGGRLIITANP